MIPRMHPCLSSFHIGSPILLHKENIFVYIKYINVTPNFRIRFIVLYLIYISLFYILIKLFYTSIHLFVFDFIYLYNYLRRKF